MEPEEGLITLYEWLDQGQELLYTLAQGDLEVASRLFPDFKIALADIFEGQADTG